MKIYIQEYEIGKPSVQKITVPEQSDIKLRFKLKGEDVANITSESLSEITIKDGYGECKLNTGLPRTENINVVINDKSFKMIMVVVESDVYEQTDDVKLPEIKDNSKEVEELKTRTELGKTTRCFISRGSESDTIGVLPSENFSQPILPKKGPLGGDFVYSEMGDPDDPNSLMNAYVNFVANPIDRKLSPENEGNSVTRENPYWKKFFSATYDDSDYYSKWSTYYVSYGEAPIKNAGVEILNNANEVNVNFTNTYDEMSYLYVTFFPYIKLPNSLTKVGSNVFEYDIKMLSPIADSEDPDFGWGTYHLTQG
jgi:hypothetical protein